MLVSTKLQQTMKQYFSISNSSVAMLLSLTLVIFNSACKRDVDDLQGPGFPKTADVFIDTFTPDLGYAAFGGSDVRAFQVDNQVTYGGSNASMRIAVPDENSTLGAYAGGTYFSNTGRDLSGFNALTFYIKASQPATIAVLGFGNDLAASKYQVALNNVPVNTNWKKVIIPLPDPAKLTAEKGLFYFSTGAENGKGYTFWIDEVKYEKLGGIAQWRGIILNGEDRTNATAEVGDAINLDGLRTLVNMPDGVDQAVETSPHYFEFTSTDPSVAALNANGQVQILKAGSSVITAKLRGIAAKGSMSITAKGAPILPTTPAPTPTRNPSNVISLYSNAYNNVTVDTWNTRWQFSTADNAFIQINGDDVIRYRNLNFVGIEFASSPIDATAMSHFHIDIWTPDPTDGANNFKVLLVDFGANGVFGGGDDKSHELTFTRPTLVSNNWVSLDIPLANFTGLTTRGHLAQLVLSGTVPNVFVDNVYFYGVPTSPTSAAPVPNYPAADVISIFSDAYTNVNGTDLNPNWGQATAVAQIPIAGNNTLRYTGLNYQGIQFGSNQNVSGFQFLHLDYFTANSSNLNVYIISPGPIETAYKLTVPSTSGWNSVDIPLSVFAPVALNNVFQMKFDGNGTIYLDNILFRK